VRQTDLELYRWKWHNEVYLKFKRVQAVRSQMLLSSYWKEYGAFVSVLPRQLGKTTMLGVIAKHLLQIEGHAVQIIVPTSHMKLSVANKIQLPSNYIKSVVEFVGSNQSDLSSAKHLLVDEFDFIDRMHLIMVLDNDWKSVTMVSTLR